MYLDAVERWRWSASRSLHILPKTSKSQWLPTFFFSIFLIFFSFFATFHISLLLFLSFIRIIVCFLSFFRSNSISTFFAFSLVYPAHINLSETILIHWKLLLSRDSLFCVVATRKRRKKKMNFYFFFCGFSPCKYWITKLFWWNSIGFALRKELDEN